MTVLCDTWLFFFDNGATLGMNNEEFGWFGSIFEVGRTIFGYGTIFGHETLKIDRNFVSRILFSNVFWQTLWIFWANENAVFDNFILFDNILRNCCFYFEIFLFLFSLWDIFANSSSRKKHVSTFFRSFKEIWPWKRESKRNFLANIILLLFSCIFFLQKSHFR